MTFPRHTFSTPARRLFHALLFLPLLLLLSGAQPGAWFCADGAWCGSSADPTCCCGPAHLPSADCCASDGNPGLAATDGCRCFYQASPARAALRHDVLALNFPASLPAAPPDVAAPAVVRVAHAPTRPDLPPVVPRSRPAPRGPPVLSLLSA